MSTEKHIGYKIVRVTGGKYYSAVMCNDVGKVGGMKKRECVEYKLNTPAYPDPNCGPLCIFDSLENAETFLLYEGSCNKMTHTIFKAEYTPSTHVKNLDYVIWYPQLTYLGVFRYTNGCYEFELPKGTVLCDSITLLEEVKL